MDHADLVKRAAQGDVKAFVELTRRFQQFAFGSALTHVRDFQRAEDVTQEALIAAWTALPTLTEPVAFAGWLRSIVRHHSSRSLRRKRVHVVPLAEAEELSDDAPPPDHVLERRRQAAASQRSQICRRHCASPPRCSSSTTARIRTSRPFSDCRPRPSTTAFMPLARISSRGY